MKDSKNKKGGLISKIKSKLNLDKYNSYIDNIFSSANNLVDRTYDKIFGSNEKSDKNNTDYISDLFSQATALAEEPYKKIFSKDENGKDYIGSVFEKPLDLIKSIYNAFLGTLTEDDNPNKDKNNTNQPQKSNISESYKNNESNKNQQSKSTTNTKENTHTINEVLENLIDSYDISYNKIRESSKNNKFNQTYDASYDYILRSIDYIKKNKIKSEDLVKAISKYFTSTGAYESKDNTLISKLNQNYKETDKDKSMKVLSHYSEIPILLGYLDGISQQEKIKDNMNYNINLAYNKEKGIAAITIKSNRDDILSKINNEISNYKNEIMNKMNYDRYRKMNTEMKPSGNSPKNLLYQTSTA